MLGYTYLNPLAQFYGNWKKDQMKRWMGERVEDAQELILEFEKEENTVH